MKFDYNCSFILTKLFSYLRICMLSNQRLYHYSVKVIQYGFRSNEYVSKQIDSLCNPSLRKLIPITGDSYIYFCYIGALTNLFYNKTKDILTQTIITEIKYSYLDWAVWMHDVTHFVKLWSNNILTHVQLMTSMRKCMRDDLIFL